MHLETADWRSDRKRAAGFNYLWLTFLICKMGIVLVKMFLVTGGRNPTESDLS